MRWIDDRGRILGRVNVVDAAAAGAALIFIFLTSTFALRLVVAWLTEPAVWDVLDAEPVPGGGDRIILRGRNFDPQCRVKVDVQEAESVTCPDSNRLVVELPWSLTSGGYTLTISNRWKRICQYSAFLEVEPRWEEQAARVPVVLLCSFPAVKSLDLLKELNRRVPYRRLDGYRYPSVQIVREIPEQKAVLANLFVLAEKRVQGHRSSYFLDNQPLVVGRWVEFNKNRLQGFQLSEAVPVSQKKDR